MGYLLGFDIGSSSVKVAIVDSQTKKVVTESKSPSAEMPIISHHHGWAEQHPETWWDNLVIATRQVLRQANNKKSDIVSIGIAYQMHGLVLLDKDGDVLRPAIIWCDSRAVEIGERALREIGKDKCLTHLLNAPANFTASKLKWVKDNEPDIYRRIHKVMLPGDYIAYRLTGQLSTTILGLSEGVFWDFKENEISATIIEYFGFDRQIFPERVENYTEQGKLYKYAAAELDLYPDIPLTYRAGDQPNNAMSLGVFDPGQVAATGGTSGVIYAVSEQFTYDKDTRTNAFAHVNHTAEKPRIGHLICINGAGIQYAWMRRMLAENGLEYSEIEMLIERIPIGSDDLRILPFGNGAERMLGNHSPGAQINNLQFNRHGKAHLYRAALEGIAFSFVYGFKLLKNITKSMTHIKTGNDNLFRSKIFSTTICNLIGVPISVMNTSGAVGAAIASGIAAGTYTDLYDAFANVKMETEYAPSTKGKSDYERAYDLWINDLHQSIK